MHISEYWQSVQDDLVLKVLISQNHFKKLKETESGIRDGFITNDSNVFMQMSLPEMS